MTGRRMRVCFELDGDARFLSHLDQLRLTERALRRSRLGVGFTEGFNPHVRISMPPARPVGVASRGEWFGIWVTDDSEPDDVHRRLAAVFPAGIRIVKVEEGPPPGHDRPTWLTLEVNNGEAAAQAVARSLIESQDDRFRRILCRGATLVMEIKGGESDQRPPRVREFVGLIDSTLTTLGYQEGTGVPVKHSGSTPEHAVD